MPTQYTAADLYAIAEGRHSLRRVQQAATDPRPANPLKPALRTRPEALPAPRRRPLTAADILAISRHAQPWHAQPERAPLSEAG